MRSFLGVAQTARRLARPPWNTDASPELERLRSDLQACVSGRGGASLVRARAGEIAARYEALPPLARRRFFHMLTEFDVDHDAVDRGVAELGGAASDAERAAAERRLRAALVPQRVALLRAFNSSPSGVKLLVGMRADLLELVPTEPELARVEADFKELLATWFDLGFLELRRITWDAPASMLEKIGRYEAVHEVRGWSDLKNRLDADRRCFAFVHPAMPNEPLIFVEVALTNEMSAAMAPLLDQQAPVSDPEHATHAIFYSISNCQRGLDGISFGNALIKRVVAALAAEFRHLRVFATLSPIPRFREWLDTLHGADGEPPLAEIFRNRRWFRDPSAPADALRLPLLQLCAHYLLEARRPNGRVYDDVAHFHLSNGARLERINWLADRSSRGVRESAGMMVNYVYAPERIEANQEAYALHQRIAASPAVTALLPQRRTS